MSQLESESNITQGAWAVVPHCNQWGFPGLDYYLQRNSINAWHVYKLAQALPIKVRHRILGSSIPLVRSPSRDHGRELPRYHSGQRQEGGQGHQGEG